MYHYPHIHLSPDFFDVSNNKKIFPYNACCINWMEIANLQRERTCDVDEHMNKTQYFYSKIVFDKNLHVAKRLGFGLSLFPLLQDTVQCLSTQWREQLHMNQWKKGTVCLT